MIRRARSILAATTALAISSLAQTPTEPTAYTVTTRIQIISPVIRKTYRLGPKVLVDQYAADGAPGDHPTRTLYNLQTMESLTWNPAGSSAPCVRANFGPHEWLDPFEGGTDLTVKDVKQTGIDTSHGAATVILESDKKPGFRLWVDPKTGLMWKSEFTAKALGKTITYFEVTDVNLTPPSASIFHVPSGCDAAKLAAPTAK